MDNITDLLERLTINFFDIGSATWVDITHINNPHSFYVRPYDHRAYLKNIELPGDFVHDQDILPHTVVVYFSILLKNMVRGVVSNVDSSNRTCVLWALDYGVMDVNIPFDLLHKPKLDIAIEGLAVHCKLHHCAPLQGNGWAENSIDAMKSYIGNDRAKMIVKGKISGQLSVELYNYCPDDISTLLALTGYSTLGYVPSTINRLDPKIKPEDHFYTYLKLNLHDYINVKLLHKESYMSFYVAKMDDYKQYLNEQSNVTYYSKQEQQLREEGLLEGRPVAVLIDATLKYERAVVKKILIPGLKALVQLVDLGNTIETSIFNLKPMSIKLFRYPAISIYCSLSKEQTNQNLFQLFYPGNMFNISVTDIGDNPEIPYTVFVSP